MIDQINLLSPKSVINTGDIMNNPYMDVEHAYAMMSGISSPWVAIKGNHDADVVWLKKDYAFTLDGLRLIFLHGVEYEVDYAVTTEESLAFVESELQDLNGLTPIMLSHYSVMDQWYGAYVEANQTAILALLNTYNVPLYLCGHTHADFGVEIYQQTTHISGGTPVQYYRGGNGGFMICDDYLFDLTQFGMLESSNG